MTVPEAATAAETVIITGPNRGLGLELVRVAAASGYRVIALGRHAPPGLDAQFLHWDLGTPQAMPESELQEVLEATPASVTAILNAGTLGALGPATYSQRHDLSAATSVNFLSHAVLASFLAEWALAHERRLRIVLVSTGAARRAIPGWATYCASKAAEEMYVQCLALDYPNVQVDIIDPGVMDTKMQRAVLSFAGQAGETLLTDPALVAERIIRQPGTS